MLRCPKCNKMVKVVGGKVIHHGPMWAAKRYWFCDDCEVYIDVREVGIDDNEMRRRGIDFPQGWRHI